MYDDGYHVTDTEILLAVATTAVGFDAVDEDGSLSRGIAGSMIDDLLCRLQEEGFDTELHTASAAWFASVNRAREIVEEENS